MPKHTVSPRAKRLWQRLIEWYGARITEQFGEVPPEDWCATIDGVDNETVKRGLTIIRTKYMVYPPTLPQFDDAMAPAKTAKGAREPTVQERLCAYVARSYGDMLTPKQLAMPWTYIGKRFTAQDGGGKTTEDHGFEITGVVIAADGDSQGYRVMVVDMDSAAVDWGHPDPQANSAANSP